MIHDRSLAGQKSASGKSNIRWTESGNIVPAVFTPVLAKCSKSFPLVGYTLRNSCVHEGASPNFTIWGRTREKFQLLRRSDFRFFGPLRPNPLNGHAREFHLLGAPTGTDTIRYSVTANEKSSHTRALCRMFRMGRHRRLASCRGFPRASAGSEGGACDYAVSAVSNRDGVAGRRPAPQGLGRDTK